jgi:hypothetical protein
MSILQTKTCSKCRALLKLENFYVRKDGRYRTECKHCIKKRNSEYHQANKEKIKQTTKKWAKNNKERIRDSKLKSKFGITLEQKEILFKGQGNCCAICKSTQNTKNRDWDVDHCHDTNAIRGILCSNCNRALGLFKDSPENLLSAYEYLRKWKQ